MGKQGRDYGTQQRAGTQQEAGMQQETMTKADLYIGESGIRRVQEALNNKGYPAGKLDGVWGEKTRNALMDFQKALGIEPTGELNLETMKLLVGSADIQLVDKSYSGAVRGYYGEK